MVEGFGFNPEGTEMKLLYVNETKTPNVCLTKASCLMVWFVSNFFNILFLRESKLKSFPLAEVLQVGRVSRNEKSLKDRRIGKKGTV